MAIASGGGHWIEMRRLLPAFKDLDVFFVSIAPSAALDVPDHRYYSIRDVSRRNSLGFFILILQLIRILLVERPTKVITTGSAPALVALSLAKVLLRAQTMWIDSIANVRVMSSSGRQARRVADVWLTQSPQVATPAGPQHWGSVL
ncbi:UDP-N-acetylglucosamine--LPS N-acetylglucosamine transferase [Aureimonas pseudogalii]|uniref:UDP-N-acetylglucosamine:LPS N-acetylglucosamine transferase n=1 Tax=Aureimonas pseudogalii TaxID=1744844 RepID=A0A7W6EAT1_9HYPH|nr:UDP-N-acetylglucosamine--LPS N-acetylglucosamine transferase [Aureimonas pseudogalii]MBB3997898.1 UDP-N-acetylglucosamine:LPS N-acetylglucosamine transferase [Aureimonas pseudogalii]